MNLSDKIYHLRKHWDILDFNQRYQGLSEVLSERSNVEGLLDELWLCLIKTNNSWPETVEYLDLANRDDPYNIDRLYWVITFDEYGGRGLADEKIGVTNLQRNRIYKYIESNYGISPSNLVAFEQSVIASGYEGSKRYLEDLIPALNRYQHLMSPKMLVQTNSIVTTITQHTEADSDWETFEDYMEIIIRSLIATNNGYRCYRFYLVDQALSESEYRAYIGQHLEDGTNLTKVLSHIVSNYNISG